MHCAEGPTQKSQSRSRSIPIAIPLHRDYYDALSTVILG